MTVLGLSLLHVLCRIMYIMLNSLLYDQDTDRSWPTPPRGSGSSLLRDSLRRRRRLAPAQRFQLGLRP